MGIEKHGFNPAKSEGAFIRPYSERSSYGGRPRAPSVVNLTVKVQVLEECA